jgi:transcriptional regulator with XRE-family HTH domain
MTKSVFTEAYASMLEVLTAARKDAGVSQIELAERLGKTQSFVSQIERGVRRLDLIEFCAFARGLRLEPTELFAAISRKLPTKIEI